MTGQASLPVSTAKTRNLMNRRQALERVSMLMGGVMIGGQAFLNSSFSFHSGSSFLTEAQIRLMNEIGETILPETDTPGARAADVGRFMSVIVADCYTPADQRVFLEGISKVEEASRKMYSQDFLKLTSGQRETLLAGIDNEHIAYMKNRKADEPVHYFRMFKELTLAGYFTSEPGATKFLKYNPAPGRYDGCTTERPWH